MSVLIPDGESWLAQGVFDSLIEADEVAIVVLATNPTSLHLKYSAFTKSFIEFIDLSDDPQLWAKKVVEVVQKEEIDVVLPISLSVERLAALEQSELTKLTKIAPYISIDHISLARNKADFSIWLSQHNFAQPATVVDAIHFPDSASLKSLRFPVLIKPRLGFAGQGIVKFDTFETLVSYIKQHKIDVKQYIFQSYVKGYDVDCNFLCDKGKVIAYSVQKPMEASYSKFQPPYNISFYHEPEVVRLGTQILERLNWTGVANFDFRFDLEDHTLKVLELNPRYWRSVFASTAAGVNFPYLACVYALRGEIPPQVYNDIHFVQSSYLINSFVKHSLRFKRFPFDKYRSTLKVNLRDPMPKLYQFASKVSQRLKRKL